MGKFLQKLLIDNCTYASASAFTLELLNFGRFDAESGCYSPSDIMEAHRLFNANCGPASFSAVCRSSVQKAMQFFPHFPARDWTTIGDMKKALHAAQVKFADAGKALPEYGMALLQLRVNDRPLHPLFSLSQTHWVGVCRGCFYDVNWGGWLTIPLWKELVLSQLRFGVRPVIGWEIRNSLSVLEESYVRTAFGRKVENCSGVAVYRERQEAYSAANEGGGPVAQEAQFLSCDPQFDLNKFSDLP